MFDQWIICDLLCTGTFASDAKRRIHNRNIGTLDDIIEIHEALCTLVFNTVSTYKLWFVFHWLSYGVVVILSVIYLSIEFHSRHKYGTPTLNLVYLCLFFVCHVYLFLVPCIFAARITSCCTGKNLFIVTLFGLEFTLGYVHTKPDKFENATFFLSG